MLDKTPPLPRQATRLLLPNSLGQWAVRLLTLAGEAGAGGLLHVAASERRAERLGRILRALAPTLEVVVLPAWDCLPFDRAAPSREVMGRRTVALGALAEPGEGEPRILLTTPDALIQRVPPPSLWAEACLAFRTGEPLRTEDLAPALAGLGYLEDERVDEPGEFALRGQVLDIFPAGASEPVRIDHADGQITEIRRFDPASQITRETLDEVVVAPVSEAATPQGAEAPERFGGMEHWLPEFYPRLASVFDYVPGATLVLEPGVEARRQTFMEQIADAYESRRRLRPERTAARPPLPPEKLYLPEEEWRERLAGHTVLQLEAETKAEAEAIPVFVSQARPYQACAGFLKSELASGRRVVLAAPSEEDLAAIGRRLQPMLGRKPERVESWDAVAAARPDALLALQADFDAGFVDPEAEITVVAAADVLGSRARAAPEEQSRPVESLGLETRLQIGDAVIHVDHGLGALKGIEPVPAGESEPVDLVRLEYAGEDRLLVPTDALDRIWRYGADAGAISLDRLEGEAWPKRRAKVEAEIAESARRLVTLAREREATNAPKLVPPRPEYERFARRFPFTETPDQARAIEDTLQDLASGRPMDRLVCGDVGFGKTEVALRAAAAAALAGKQVAVIAPTTVLVRQHLQTFQRRFANLGIEIVHLSRLVKPAEAREAKQRLSNGSARIVIGTHALAGKGMRFADLGLVIIDEEQRFGAAQKAKLRGLASGLHVLALTATPIPRTLQAALVGLQDLSIIATPPARRRPIRTFVISFDEATVREALLRERRRGGQSFVVCPRIEDMQPMAERLSRLVPELDILEAHGEMPAEAIDEAMLRFADGDGDVLLATNIIESGLDVPRANTMLVWRADRFGLAQLHQLRGRVGRGRMRGVAYLLTDPAAKIAAATKKRLRTLETLDRLGAGFAISARDLDMRGAGDLLGEDQAGHMKLIGVDLYRRLLEGALASARGEEPAPDWSPELNVGLRGTIPEEYVPDPEMRINLYARLSRVSDQGAIDALADEFEDRFGPRPELVEHLFALSALRQRCRQHVIARIDAGPQAIALTFRDNAMVNGAVEAAIGRSQGGVAWRGERLVCRRDPDDAAGTIDAAQEWLDRIFSA